MPQAAATSATASAAALRAEPLRLRIVRSGTPPRHRPRPLSA